MICMENLNTWWLCQAWHSPSMAVPGCSNYLSAPMPKQESLSYALRPDCRGIFGLCGVLDKYGLLSWLCYGKQAWCCPAGAPGQTWLHQLQTFYSLFLSFHPHFHHTRALLSLSVSSQIKNSALTTFFSPLLYPILGFLGNLSFTWYYWHSYLVGLHVPTAAYKLHVKWNHFSSNFTIISTRFSHPSQSYLKFVHLFTLSYPGISHVTSHIVSMSWSVCLMWGQCQHLTSVLILLLAKSLHRCLCAFLNSKNCFSSP